MDHVLLIKGMDFKKYPKCQPWKSVLALLTFRLMAYVHIGPLIAWGGVAPDWAINVIDGYKIVIAFSVYKR
jgi:hypothetical protein